MRLIGQAEASSNCCLALPAVFSDDTVPTLRDGSHLPSWLRVRLTLTQLPLDPILDVRLTLLLPFHVRRQIQAARAEWIRVVNDPAEAGASCLVGRRTRVSLAERTDLGGV